MKATRWLIICCLITVGAIAILWLSFIEPDDEITTKEGILADTSVGSILPDLNMVLVSTLEEWMSYAKSAKNLDQLILDGERTRLRPIYTNGFYVAVTVRPEKYGKQAAIIAYGDKKMKYVIEGGHVANDSRTAIVKFN